MIIINILKDIGLIILFLIVMVLALLYAGIDWIKDEVLEVMGK